MAKEFKILGNYDRIPRAINQIFYVRDIMTTGTVALVRAQEATVISAIPGTFLDVIQITATNTSTAAASVTIRSVTGGNTEDILVVPAGGTTAISYQPALPQGNTGNNWTAQQTGTTDQSDSPVTVTMRALQNI